MCDKLLFETCDVSSNSEQVLMRLAKSRSAAGKQADKLLFISLPLDGEGGPLAVDEV